MKKFNFITTITKECFIEAENEEQAWEIYIEKDVIENVTFDEISILEVK